MTARELAAILMRHPDLPVLVVEDDLGQHESPRPAWPQSGSSRGGHLSLVTKVVRLAEARVDAMKKAAGAGGPDEPLCCQRYPRLHHTVFSVAGCRWLQMETTS